MRATDLHISLISELPASERAAIFSALTNEEALALLHDWPLWARPEQLPPDGDWQVWFIMAGRGFGKTRTGAETMRAYAETGIYGRMGLIGATAGDVRDVMVEGESGILAVAPPWNKPHYEPSKRRITWPNGAQATTYSADEPERLRGPQHDFVWGDEPASWRYPEAWDMAMFGLRLGDRPRATLTGTPKVVKLIKEILKQPTTVLTRGTTYDNRANLPESFFTQIITKYEGTRLGRQELLAELLEDIPGALWNHGMIDATRVSEVPTLKRVVVAIDPAVTSNDESNDTGMIVAGLGTDGHGYILDDVTLHASPAQWGARAVQTYYRWEADRIVAETNNGGDMIEHTIRMIDNSVSFKQVRASRGKLTRAEPVAALYEQRRVHHVGMLANLEDQMCTYVPGDDSPDRMDALVWALTELMVFDQPHWTISENPFYS